MTTYTGTPKATARLRTLLAACGTALALGTVAGLGAWQVSVHGHRGHGTPVTSAPAAGQQISTQASTSPSSTSSGVPLTAATPYLYLVGSAEQATEVQQGMNWATAAGLSVDATVRQVAGDAEAEAAMRDVAAENAFSVPLGLPPIQVRDLRSASSSTPVMAAPPQAP